MHRFGIDGISASRFRRDIIRSLFEINNYRYNEAIKQIYCPISRYLSPLLLNPTNLIVRQAGDERTKRTCKREKRAPNNDGRVYVRRGAEKRSTRDRRLKHVYKPIVMMPA